MTQNFSAYKAAIFNRLFTKSKYGDYEVDFGHFINQSVRYVFYEFWWKTPPYLLQKGSTKKEFFFKGMIRPVILQRISSKVACSFRMIISSKGRINRRSFVRRSFSNAKLASISWTICEFRNKFTSQVIYLRYVTCHNLWSIRQWRFWMN